MWNTVCKGIRVQDQSLHAKRFQNHAPAAH